MVMPMYFTVNEVSYPVEIEKKKTTKNTYIRIKNDLTVYVTTNSFTSNRQIENLLIEKKQAIAKMIFNQQQKNKNNSDFHYLGKRYEIVYTNQSEIIFGTEKVFMNKKIDIDRFYKNQAKKIFLEHLNSIYEQFSYRIPYPSLKIRKMTTRWGVCNTKLKAITLNLELMKRDTKYLDYVIVHELSHLIHANHSQEFWKVVGENYPNYKQIKKEMKEF